MTQRPSGLQALFLAIGLLLALGLGGCSSDAEAAPKARNPYIVEQVEGAEHSRLILEPEAVARTVIATGTVSRPAGPDGTLGPLQMPYAALLYKPDGSTFAYTTAGENVFLGQPVVVSAVEGDVALLAEGPEPGTVVVTDGAAELMGVEFGVGK